MSPTTIARYRLARQQLGATQIRSAVEMVEWLGAVQGQEYAQTKWGLGLRLPHLKDRDIESELIQVHILRTHLLRPTWHFVSAKDIHWLLALTAPRVHQAIASMYRQLELDSVVLGRCIDILTALLAGGKQLTRKAINQEFLKHNIMADGHRLSYIMTYAELEGLVCSGARQGKQFTYALLEERTGVKKSFDKEEALGKLTARYFSSRGPATVRDFATWSGLTIADCKRGMAINQALLQKEEVDGHVYFYHADMPVADQPSKSMFLLPMYDELIMGYKDRSAIMQLKGDALSRYGCMLVYDGQVIGTWKRSLSNTKVELAYDFFRPLDPAQDKAFELAIAELGEFTGLKVVRGKSMP